MKKIVYFGMIAVTAIVMVGCGSSKQTPVVVQNQQQSYSPGGNTFDLPCADANKSDKQYFRQLGIGKDTELSIAQKNALKNAQDLLIQRLGGKVSGLVEYYSKTYQKSRKGDDLSGIVEYDLKKAVVESVNSADNPCEKAAQLASGEFQYYYVIEVEKKVLAKQMADVISNDDKLNTDFNREQFRKFTEDYLENQR